MTDEQKPAERYALVEIMGHRSHAGRVMEVEEFGAKMLRIDVPHDPEFTVYTSHLYPPSALFGIRFCDRETAIKAAMPYRPALGYARRRDPDDDAAGDTFPRASFLDDDGETVTKESEEPQTCSCSLFGDDCAIKDGGVLPYGVQCAREAVPQAPAEEPTAAERPLEEETR